MANQTIEQLRKELAEAKAAEKAAREQLKAASQIQPHAEVDGDFVTVFTGVSSPKRMKLTTARVVRDVLVNTNIG